ncbi:60S ribosomal protein L21, partial [Galemys pyrenaicus]
MASDMQIYKKSDSSFLESMKENDQGEKKGGGSVRTRKDTWTQLEPQPALPREPHCVRTKGKGPEPLKTTP